MILLKNINICFATDEFSLWLKGRLVFGCCGSTPPPTEWLHMFTAAVFHNSQSAKAFVCKDMKFMKWSVMFTDKLTHNKTENSRNRHLSKSESEPLYFVINDQNKRL